jgi:hypothetical protein
MRPGEEGGTPGPDSGAGPHEDSGQGSGQGPWPGAIPSEASATEAAEARRLAALYGLGDPPEDDGKGNPFWWIWAVVVPFMLLAVGLMVYRILSTPSRTLPGL